MRKPTITRITCAFLAGVLLLLTPGCQQISESEKFDAFSREVFISSITQSGLTLNSMLEDPSAFGIKELPLLPKILPEDLEEEDDQTPEQALKELRQFRYNELTPSQQVLYEIFENNIQLNAMAEDLDLYDEPNGADSGIQASLPFSLAEYTFYKEADIAQYFKLLEDVPRFFEDNLEFQKRRSAEGLFMSDDSLKQTLDAMKSFMEDDDNVLYSSFRERLEKFPEIPADKREDYIAKNDKLVKETVLPAFAKLAEGLQALKRTGKNEGGLSDLPQGKLYYEYLAKIRTGLDVSVEEMRDRLNDELNTIPFRVNQLGKKNPDLWERYEALMKNPPVPSDPSEILTALSKSVTRDFPAIAEVDWVIREVPASLEDSTSAAFYMLPPFDSNQENVIYFNKKYGSSPMSLTSTLAHEGYPGHLYQRNYMKTIDDNPCRTIMGPLGYTEGWSVYVQTYAYAYMGIEDQTLSDFLNLNDLYNRCLSARMDIGVHYEGWDLDTLADFLTYFGISDKEAVKQTYLQILANPSGFLPYALGRLEMERMRDSVKKELGDAFDIKGFHKALLDIGPAYFETVEKKLDEYVSWVKSGGDPQGDWNGQKSGASIDSALSQVVLGPEGAPAGSGESQEPQEVSKAA